MNVAAIADAIVSEAMKPPRRKHGERVRLCQYAGSFCGFCEEIPPCVSSEQYQDCDACTEYACTESACPCMIGYTAERRAAHKAWKTHLDAANATTRERRRRYRMGRWHSNNPYHPRAYSQGRTCAGDDCEEKITDRNKSGLCKRCAAARPRT